MSLFRSMQVELFPHIHYLGFMARKRIIRQAKFPYHVFIRSNNRDWFKIPLYRMWDILFECFQYALEKVPVKIHCFVLMNNHYHMLVTTPNSDLSLFMEFFNRKLSQSINKEATVANHKFANGFKWTIIQSERYLYNIYRYIYQNPVRAGLCNLCIDYPYSSLRLSPSQTKKLKIHPHIDYFGFRSWMEHRKGSELDDVIRKALNKRIFSVRKQERRFVHKIMNENPS